MKMRTTFGENLQFLRQQRGLSRKDFAEKLNIPAATTVQSYETGGSEPQFTRLIEISKFFNVSIDDLLTSTDKNFEKIKLHGLFDDKSAERIFDLLERGIITMKVTPPEQNCTVIFQTAPEILALTLEKEKNRAD